MNWTVDKWVRRAVERRSPLTDKPTPSLVEGEGWGEGEHSQGRLRMSVLNRPLSLALKELLAARLSPQAGKSTVISPPGEGNGGVIFPVCRQETNLNEI